MSDARPEFRPLTFPRAAAPQPTTSVAAAPAGTHSHVETLYEADGGADQFAGSDDLHEESNGDLHEESHDETAADESGSIAGRIGHDDAPRAAHPDGAAAPGELSELLLRMGQRLRGHLDTQFGAFGLSDARFAALSVIREASPAGCTQAHLAAKLGQCESSISTLVERMRASRLLYRLRAKSDRRKRVLMLTDDGRRLFEQGLEARDREAESLFARMDLEERTQLAGVLGRLYGRLDSLPASHADRQAA